MSTPNDNDVNDAEAAADDSTPSDGVPKAKSARRGSMLGAAMLGLGEVLEPEKANTDVVVESRLDTDDDLGKKFDLDFGQLDDLDSQP